MHGVFWLADTRHVSNLHNLPNQEKKYILSYLDKLISAVILIQTVKDQKNIHAGRDLERSMIMMGMLPIFCKLLQLCCQFSTRNCDVCLKYSAAFLVKVIHSPIDALQFFEVLF